MRHWLHFPDEEELLYTAAQMKDYAILARFHADAKRAQMAASVAAIHCRLVTNPITEGTVPALIEECEHAIPELAAIRTSIRTRSTT
jgi:hypothetical protein